MNVPVKLIVSCNLKPGREAAKDALAYLTQEFASNMRDAGINLADVWFTVYGNWPHVRLCFKCQESEVLASFIRSDAWVDQKQRLMQHIETLNYKVVIWQDHFQF